MARLIHNAALSAAPRMLDMPDAWRKDPPLADAVRSGAALDSNRVAQLEAQIAQREAELAEAASRLARWQNEETGRTAQVYQEAAARGHAEGQARAHNEAQAGLRKEVAHIHVLLHSMLQQQSRRAGECEDVLVEIAFAAVCRLLGEQETEAQRVRALVRRAVADLADRDGLRVRLHPDDVALLADLADPVAPEVTVVADPTIRMGGCLVDAAGGTLDARLETQLAELAGALAATRAARRARGEEA